jgi:hypothetical protein
LRPTCRSHRDRDAAAPPASRTLSSHLNSASFTV